MRWVLALVAILILPSCEDPPQLDCRVLGCDEGYECKEVDGGWTCVAIPPDTSTLLRREGTTFVRVSDGQPFDWKGLEHCCWDADPDGDGVGWTHSMGWPVINNKLVDHAAQQGATVLHARLGPFTAGPQGEKAWPYGPYVQRAGGRADLAQFDSRFWDDMDASVEYAQEKGIVVVLDQIDGWACRHAKAGNWRHPWRSDWNIQGLDAVSSCGQTVNPTQRAFVVKLVSVFADNPNIVWEDGNEIGLVRNAAGVLEADPLYDPAWTRELARLTRVQEQANGGFAHLFGSNAGQAGWNVAGVSVIFEHNTGVAVSPRAGKPTVVNEYNPNPPMTGEQVFAQVCRAKELGSYFDLWRHGMGDAEYLEAHRLIREGICGLQPTPPPSCTLGTPTASEAASRGMRPEIAVERGSGKVISATPKATFGLDYYCGEDMNWPEACAGGRTRGPVAPDGHRQRLACEQHFLQECGPTFTQAECTAPAGDCPITFDPFVCIASDGEMYEREEAIALGIECTNQNHPDNVRAGCGTQFSGHPSWVKDGGAVVKGAWWWATAHGKGYIEASDRTGTVRTRSTFEIDQ